MERSGWGGRPQPSAVVLAQRLRLCAGRSSAWELPPSRRTGPRRPRGHRCRTQRWFLPCPGGPHALSGLPLPSASPAPTGPRSCRHGGFGGKCAALTRKERSGSQRKILLDPHSLGGNQIIDVTAGKRQLVPSASAFPVWQCSPLRCSQGDPNLCSEKDLAGGAGMLHGSGAPSPWWASPGWAPWGTAVCSTALVLRVAQPKNTLHFYPRPV